MSKKTIAIASALTGLLLTGGLVAAQHSVNNPMQIAISQNGNAVLRGTVTSVGTNTLTVASWGGSWIVNTNNARIVRNQIGNAALNTIMTGDGVTVRGTAVQNQATINATLVVVSSAHPHPPTQQPLTLGNDANSRSVLDTFSNFTVIDQNHNASQSGNLTQFKYWASNTNPFRFVLVNPSNVVQWVSPQITPSATGMNTWNPSSPVPVQQGWKLGAYFASTGTIPFEWTGATALATGNNVGAPQTGSTMSLNNAGGRTYSFMATGTTGNVGNPNFTGNWTITFTTGNSNFAHTMNITSVSPNGNFSGTGYYNANPATTWNITGSVNGSQVNFMIVYTGTPSNYTINGSGTIQNNGTISGTAVDTNGTQLTWQATHQ